MRKTFTDQRQPTPEQERMRALVVRRGRERYTAALQERREAWHPCGVSVNCALPAAQLPEIKAVRPEYRALHAPVLQDVLPRLERAYPAFFRRVQAGEAPGYPRFQGRNRYHSFTYQPFGNGATLDNGFLNGFLARSKIGRRAGRWRRPRERTPKTVTLAQEADGWYVGCSCAEVPTQPLPLTGRETGREVGWQVFLVTAEGEAVAHPRPSRKGEQRLSNAQRRVARRTKGSNRRTTAAVLLARAPQHVRRQRADHHHQTARTLLSEDDPLSREAWRIANLVRNRALATSSSDAAWAPFRTIRAGQAAYAGRRVIAIPAQSTSQDGSGCGARVPKSLSVRTPVCPSCGLVLDRDANAALHIFRAGQARQGAVALAAVLN